MSQKAFISSAVYGFKGGLGVGGLCELNARPRGFIHREPRQTRMPRAEIESTDSATSTEEAKVDSTRVPESEALDPSSGSVIVRPTFYLASAFLLSGGGLDYAGGGWAVLGLPLTMIGVLLAVQTFRIRFVFGPKRISVANRTSDGLSIIRGWEYSQISNWEVWWKPLPILAYFKEKESYNGRGSIHFFPVLCDGAQLIQQFRERVSHIDKSDYA